MFLNLSQVCTSLAGRWPGWRLCHRSAGDRSGPHRRFPATVSPPAVSECPLRAGLLPSQYGLSFLVQPPEGVKRDFILLLNEQWDEP
jgi:hypothetical protein